MRHRLAFVSIAIVMMSASLSLADYIGNKNSMKFHSDSCTWAAKVSPRNKVVFRTTEAAVKAGHVACKVCKPGAAITIASTSRLERGTTGAYSGRCQAITKKGTQCKRNAQSGKMHCWQH